jgi:predicted aminopeptidase
MHKLVRRLTNASPIRKGLTGVLLLLIVAGVSGCHTLGFYGQAIKGQYEIFSSEQKIEKLLQDTAATEELRQRLQLVQQLRIFAKTDLKLPIDNHYLKYADLHRPFVVWNVEAAPEFSMQPKTWWYPFLGSLEYRGYFSKRGATNYANYLKRKGLDASVGGVEAYSTLGWFKDPVLNTFIFEPDADLAEIIFHELGHQRVFARGDTDFNEAFATTVGQEGARRWLKSCRGASSLEGYQSHLRRNDQFVHLVMKIRARLEALYGDIRDEEGKIQATRKNKNVPSEQLRREKNEILKEMKEEYARLKRSWDGDTEYDGWFVREVNNAHLNSVAAYYDLVPAFEHLLAMNGSDLERFYDAADRLSKGSDKERRATLKALAYERKVAANAGSPLESSGPEADAKPKVED